MEDIKNINQKEFTLKCKGIFNIILIYLIGPTKAGTKCKITVKAENV